LALERALQAALGGGCHTAFGAYAAADTLYLFHPEVGLRTLPLAPSDYADPAAAARRVLGHLKLMPS
jgi:hydroxymethylbilane synthase